MGAPFWTLLKNIAISNFRRLAFPYKLTFAVTYKCNSKCKTCNIWQKSSVNELCLEEIQHFFKKNNRFSWIDLTGGEIFLRNDFLAIVETILHECKNLYLLHFPTNGLMTDKIVSTVKSILQLKPRRLIITVSVDGNKEVNDNIRGVSGAWERQIKTFDALYSIRNVEVFLGMTLSLYNFEELEATFKSVKEKCRYISYDDLHINIAHTSSHYYNNTHISLNNIPTAPLIFEIKRYMKRRSWISPVAFLEKEYIKRIEQYLKNGQTPLSCHALWSSCFLDPYGFIFPCTIYDASVGNIRDEEYDLKKLWESARSKELQRIIWDPHCPQCWTPCEAYQSILGSLLSKRAKAKMGRICELGG